MRKISPPTGILSPDRPAISPSLYRLSYRARRPPIPEPNFVYICLAVLDLKPADRRTELKAAFFLHVLRGTATPLQEARRYHIEGYNIVRNVKVLLAVTLRSF